MYDNDNDNEKTTTIMIKINETLMEAIILLDPPPFPPPHAGSRNDDSRHSRFSTCIRQAHDILLSAASWLTTMMDHYAHDDDDDAHDEKAVTEIVTTVADLYRALIVSSNLLLEAETIPPPQVPRSAAAAAAAAADGLELVNGDNDKLSSSSISLSISTSPAILYSTIIQSILLLKRLSHFSYMSHPKKINDWHDDLLPKSRHSLLLECFQRKIMMDVEADVVFGLEDRLVSLEEVDYDVGYCHDCGWNCHGDHDHDDDDDYVSISSSRNHRNHEDHDHHEQQQQEEEEEEEEEEDEEIDVSNINQESKKSLQHIPFTLNPNELEQEESDLLAIALPGYYLDNGQDKHAGKKKNKNKRKRQCNEQQQHHQQQQQQSNQSQCKYLSKTMIHQLKEMGLFHHISLPFYGMSCIMKQGWLILQLETINTEEKADVITCHARMFSNGVLLLELDSECEPSLNRKIERINVKMFTITATSRCSASPSNHTFYFHIDDLTECQEYKARNDKDEHSAKLGNDNLQLQS